MHVVRRESGVKQMHKKIKWANIYLWFVFILLYLPIFFLIVYSFNAGDVMQGWDGFSWKHYGELFADTRIAEIVVSTLLLAISASLISSVIGTAGALYVYNLRNGVMKNVFLSLNNVLLHHSWYSSRYWASRWALHRSCYHTLRLPFRLLC